MIPVALQAEPANFDPDVRQRGLAWLAANGIAVPGPAPKKPKLPAYWSATNKALWDAYGGTCAYLEKRHGKPAVALARKTIHRLKLDSPEHNQMRQRHYNQYLRHKDAQTLKELSPFVWHEAQRQGLL